MKEYKNALNFWNNFFVDKPVEKVADYTVGAKTLEDNLIKLAECGKILDFGCGAGWASMSLALLNAEVLGVDQAPNSIEYAEKIKKASEIGDNLSFSVCDESFFKECKKGEFDGCFSSNVLDVVTDKVAIKILKGIKKAVKKQGKILIMLNPYLSAELLDKTGMQKIAENMYGKDGNLRCLNRRQNEWIELFEQYFTVCGYREFIFEDENKNYQRRLFWLENK